MLQFLEGSLAGSIKGLGQLMQRVCQTGSWILQQVQQGSYHQMVQLLVLLGNLHPIFLNLKNPLKGGSWSTLALHFVDQLAKFVCSFQWDAAAQSKRTWLINSDNLSVSLPPSQWGLASWGPSQRPWIRGCHQYTQKQTLFHGLNAWSWGKDWQNLLWTQCSWELPSIFFHHWHASCTNA